MKRTPFVAATAMVLSVIAVDSRAQDSEAQRRAVAEALFTQAAAMMKAGNATEACPKLVEVVRLQPAGIGAKLELAACYEAAGQLASAHAAFMIAARAAAAVGDERATEASRRAAEVEPRVSWLTIQPPAAVPDGLEVTRNGARVGMGQFGSAIPVDGGTHVVRATAPGHATRELSVVVPREAARITLTIPLLTSDQRRDVAPDAPRATTASAASEARTGVDRDDGSEDGVAPWVWISGGAGVVLGAVAVGFAIDQGAASSEIEESCGPTRDACPDGYDFEADHAREQRDFALFVGLGAAGAVALGVATVGLIAAAADGPEPAGRAPRVTGWIGPDDGGVGLLVPIH